MRRCCRGGAVHGRWWRRFGVCSGCCRGDGGAGLLNRGRIGQGQTGLSAAVGGRGKVRVKGALVGHGQFQQATLWLSGDGDVCAYRGCRCGCGRNCHYDQGGDDRGRAQSRCPLPVRSSDRGQASSKVGFRLLIVKIPGRGRPTRRSFTIRRYARKVQLGRALEQVLRRPSIGGGLPQHPDICPQGSHGGEAPG